MLLNTLGYMRNPSSSSSGMEIFILFTVVVAAVISFVGKSCVFVIVGMTREGLLSYTSECNMFRCTGLDIATNVSQTMDKGQTETRGTMNP